MIFELELDETNSMGSLTSSKSGLFQKKFDFGAGVMLVHVAQELHYLVDARGVSQIDFNRLEVSLAALEVGLVCWGGYH